MHKNATKCNKTQSKWCINKHGASKIIDMFETYQLPSPLGPRTSSICTFPSLSNNYLGCIFSSLMYGLMMSAREFSSDELEEDMVALKLRTSPNRNRSKQKHDENMIYRPQAIRGVI
jgi:hypothetical protein